MKNEVMKSLENSGNAKKNYVKGILTRAAAFSMAASAVASMTAGQALAGSFQGESVSINNSNTDAGTMMGRIIGIMLTICRYVGIALVVYGVFEIVMSFMQNQPEAKTKGIIMALAGIVMTALKSVLVGLGVVS